MASPTPRYTILVTIVEGRYFLRDPDCQLMVQCQFNDALFIENPETDSHSYPEVLSTDPVEQTQYPIWDTELAWDLDAEVLDILRVEHASLKLTCFSINQKTNEEESLGHIILDLSTAFEPESAEEQWAALTGSQTAGFRGLQPELKLAFTIDDGIANIAEATPTIDSRLASIEPLSEEAQQKRFSKAHILQGLEEEDEPEDQYEDRDANVPSVGDKSFYHSRNHPETEVPEFDADDSMQVDIPVDVGEALIPTEVNDKGFLQLGTGRDFFIFTITIQTTQGMESLIDRYADLQRRSPESVEQGLYLYYSFLGNNVATQLLSNAESGAPIEEIALRLKSSMESMYQHFREGEELVIHLCHESNLIATATIPLALILLHGTANLFHASPQFHDFQPAIPMSEEGSSPSSSDVASIQVAMHVTRDLNTLSVPSTPAIRRSSQGTTPRRILTRPAAIEVGTSRNVNSANSTRSPRRHDYKFSIELMSFKALSGNLSNVSLRYNYRPFGPKSTQPSIDAARLVPTPLPDACRTFQLCQTPAALRNQLKTPLVVEVWCQDPETHQNVLHASGQIPLIDILDEGSAPTSEGRIQRLHSSFVAILEGSSIKVGEVQFACSLEDLGEYFDSQQSEILSTTPVHSMELHNHSRGLSDDLSSSGPEPQYGFHPRGNNIEVTSSVQGDERSLRQQPSTHFAEGYSDHDRMESSATPGRGSQRPTSVRLSQVRHLSQAHQNTHPHHHHPYGKPSSPSGKNDPPMDYHMALKQQLAKQAEVNRQVEYDLLRRSPISNLPHSIQQTLQADRSTTRPGTTLSMFENTDAGDDNMNSQQAKQKLKDIKALDYQLQKQVIALEFRERKLLRAEEALQRQQANFQKLLERHGYSQGGIQHLDQPFVFQPSASASTSAAAAGTGAQPNMSSNPTPQDFFLLQDRYRALQRQNQLLEAEFSQYRQEHPTHINMSSMNGLHQKIAELESANNKLMNDVTFANNYKEHYKALWTHSLQEIASMRQDLQMGMEIKMMQQFNEVDQLKLINMTRAEADHGQDRIILRGIKTELDMLHHQMNLFPDDNMTWEREQHQEVPRRHHHRSDREDEYDNNEDSDDDSQFDRRGRSHPFPQSQPSPRRYSQAHPANLSLQEDEDEHEDTLVDNPMMRSMSGHGSSQQKHYQHHQKQKPLQGSKLHGGPTMTPFTSAQSVHS
ncbi:MAG: Cep120 protein-domain-containing protein [Benniella sp.]|nr:MAG: Cep120 protein-domain-containing protein [Benniella sp.]